MQESRPCHSKHFSYFRAMQMKWSNVLKSWCQRSFSAKIHKRCPWWWGWWWWLQSICYFCFDCLLEVPGICGIELMYEHASYPTRLHLDLWSCELCSIERQGDSFLVPPVSTGWYGWCLTPFSHHWCSNSACCYLPHQGCSSQLIQYSLSCYQIPGGLGYAVPS